MDFQERLFHQNKCIAVLKCCNESLEGLIDLQLFTTTDKTTTQMKFVCTFIFQFI